MFEGKCVGIVPITQSERFADALRALFPRQAVTFEIEAAEGRAFLWVAPGLNTRQLARWTARYFELQASV
jgi:murein tripeptide amidase MpaA